MTQSGLGEVADSLGDKDIKYGIAELQLPAVIRTATGPTAATQLPQII